MKIGIVCAGDGEVQPFLQMLKEEKRTEKAMLLFHEGWLEETEVAVLFSGVCRVNTAVATQLLIDAFACDAVINAGTCGGIDAKLQLFDTVVSTEAAYSDVGDDILTEFHPWLDSIYFPADPGLVAAARKAAQKNGWEDRVYFGRMITGEQFVKEEKRAYIASKYAPLSADMETAGAAHVCYVNRIPFLSVRSVTDTAEHDGVDAFEENCEKASFAAADFVRLLLREL